MAIKQKHADIIILYVYCVHEHKHINNRLLAKTILTTNKRRNALNGFGYLTTFSHRWTMIVANCKEVSNTTGVPVTIFISQLCLLLLPVKVS